MAIELTKRLPLALLNPTGDPKRFAPWAMVIPAHQECVVLKGSLGHVGGQRANYACAGSGVLLGLPKRGATWRRPYATSPAATSTHRVALISVWW